MPNGLKRLLNILRCPICKSQIDILNLKIKYNFGCVQNYLHYSVFIRDAEITHYSSSLIPSIEQERVIINDKLFQYEIIQNFICMAPSETETLIYIKKIDAEGRVLEQPYKKFNYNKMFFNFQETDKNKIINRINTILTFQ